MIDTRAQLRLSVETRTGYALDIVANLAIAFAVNVWPGWPFVPFLTPSAAEVITIFNVSLIAAVLLRVLCLVFDRPMLKAASDLVLAVIALVFVIDFWVVFPLTFEPQTLWHVAARVAIAAAALGCVIAVAVTAVRTAQIALGVPQNSRSSRSNALT